VALAPAGQELGDDLGGILEVAVHGDHRGAAGQVEAGAERRLVAEIAAEVDRDHLAVLAG
jgi:hypothetical protein